MVGGGWRDAKERQAHAAEEEDGGASHFITLTVMRDNSRPVSRGVARARRPSAAATRMHILSAAITHSLLIFPPVRFFWEHLHQITRGPAVGLTDATLQRIIGLRH